MSNELTTSLASSKANTSIARWYAVQVASSCEKKVKATLEQRSVTLGVNNRIIEIENIKTYPSILKKVEKFWAYPSCDTRCPPPHSTGGALDVCLSDKDGNIVDMGSMVDQMDETSNPNFYANIKNEEAIIWNSRRNLLREIMTKFGFAQHPNEWWHFSYGDQLWAWKNKKENAIYGKI